MHTVPSHITIVCGFLLLSPLPQAMAMDQIPFPITSTSHVTIECPLVVLDLLKEGHRFSQDQAHTAWSELSTDARAHAKAFIVSLATTVERDTFAAHKSWLESGNALQHPTNPHYARWLKKATRNQEIRNLASQLGIRISSKHGIRGWV